jgi:small redox-active disulfide protein 2
MKNIEILGGACSKCHQLQANAESAAKDLGIEYQITKISDLREIMKRGVMTTPGLVVDGQVKSAGKVLSAAQIRELLA